MGYWLAWSSDAARLVRLEVISAVRDSVHLQELWEPFGYGDLSETLSPEFISLALRKQITIEAVRTPLLDQFGRDTRSRDGLSRLRDVFDSQGFHEFIGRVQVVQDTPTLCKVRALGNQLLSQIDGWDRL